MQSLCALGVEPRKVFCGLKVKEMIHYFGMINRRFGRLIVKQQAFHTGKNTNWLCLCDCGNEKIVSRPSLIQGGTQSCGCLQIECIKNRSTKHGLARTSIDQIRTNMMTRCYNQNGKNWSRYGGRGIKVCDRWHTPKNFFDDMYPSYKNGLTLERIDNDGNYSPENCRWATRSEQARNRRTTTLVTIKGEKMSLADAIDRYSIVPKGCVHSRWSKGWNIEKCLFTPLKVKPFLVEINGELKEIVPLLKNYIPLARKRIKERIKRNYTFEEALSKEME